MSLTEFSAIAATHNAHAPVVPVQTGAMKVGAVLTPVAFWVAA